MFILALLWKSNPNVTLPDLQRDSAIQYTSELNVTVSSIKVIVTCTTRAHWIMCFKAEHYIFFLYRVEWYSQLNSNLETPLD